MEILIVELAQKYPQAMTVIVVIGVLRAIFKPLQLVVDKYVEATPDKADDGKWAVMKTSRAFKFIAWFLDYTASIKIKK